MAETKHGEEEHVLYTEPSFAIYSNDDKFEMEVKSATGDGEFSFGRNSMEMIAEDIMLERGIEETVESGGLDRDCGNDLDKYYSDMICRDPWNSSVLKSYAEYLESKGDFSGAEEYYSRAMKADPKNGEIQSQYARLVWEVHGDQARASNYFKKAAKIAPDDSNVLAAYASFLWKIDESEGEGDDDNDDIGEELPNTKDDVHHSDTKFRDEERPASPPLHLAMGLGIDTIDSSRDVGGEEHLRALVEEDPTNPLFLRNYANFLYQTKGDLAKAEDYYSRALLSNPSDGQSCSLYANILWQLYRDKDRAASYFERSVQAAPDDSDVVAAYAKFLWETDAEEDSATNTK